MGVSAEKLGFGGTHKRLVREVSYSGKVVRIPTIALMTRETVDGTAIDANGFLEALSRAEDVVMAQKGLVPDNRSQKS